MWYLVGVDRGVVEKKNCNSGMEDVRTKELGVMTSHTDGTGRKERMVVYY